MWIREGSVYFSNLYSLGQQKIFRLQSLQTSFFQGEQFRHIRSPTLKYSGAGSLGCLQMMTVTPVMSSSSSTVTVVSPGSPENNWLDHWARITLRMVSRRTARVKVENRLTQEAKDVRTLAHRAPPTPGCPPQEGPSYFQDSSTDKIHTPTTSCQSQNMTKEKFHCSPSREVQP